jgi:uncharacterized protein YkwD
VGGEIVGAGYQTAADVVTGWLNSSGHRAIMLDCRFRQVGIGYVYEANDTLGWRHYWTGVFGQ